MPDLDEIVVLKYFDNTIDASIAKTKLDAYGIPCFLTEENMANLYPGQNQLSFRVRLHVFRKDQMEASEILFEKKLQIDASDIVCPRCKSKNTDRDFPKELTESPWKGMVVLLFGVLLPHRKVYRCRDCECEF